MSQSRMAVIAALGLAVLVSVADGHAFVSEPAARGTLSGSGGGYKIQSVPGSDHCKVDYCPQCQNAGFLMLNHGSEFWRPYSPMDRTIGIRGGFGMCGDASDAYNAPHKKAGFFSEGCRGKRGNREDWWPGKVVDIQIQSTAHHQGFFEFFLCDVAECHGDMTRDCFRNKKCVQLMRHPNKCDSGHEYGCAPIDPAYPGRWYMPCPAYPFLHEGTSEMTEDQTMGGPYMQTVQYKLPEDFNCGDDCVLQSYWATANKCNPNGMKEYFDDLYDRNLLSTWGNCAGDGGTTGGYADFYKTCGTTYDLFPEEFWNCADVKMETQEGVGKFNHHDYSQYEVGGNEGQPKTASIHPWYNGEHNRGHDDDDDDDDDSGEHRSSIHGHCTGNDHRCAGAPGHPFFEFKDCCNSNYECKEDSSRGWGKWCVKKNGGQCTPNYHRCAGAPGHPFVEYKECCDSNYECVHDSSRSWGQWCVKKGGNDCTPDYHRCAGAPGHPHFPYKACCNPNMQCKYDGNRGWGQWCVPN